APPLCAQRRPWCGRGARRLRARGAGALLGPGMCHLGGDLGHHVQLADAANAARFGGKPLEVERRAVWASAQDAAQRAVYAQVTGEGARVELTDTGNATAVEVVVERFLRAPVAELLAGLAHDERREPGPA